MNVVLGMSGRNERPLEIDRDYRHWRQGGWNSGECRLMLNDRESREKNERMGNERENAVNAEWKMGQRGPVGDKR